MSDNHGEGLQLAAARKAILVNGINSLIEKAEGLSFKPFPSEKYPLPMTWALYGETPETETVIADIRKRIDENPVSILENFLVLMELIESNQADAGSHIIDDAKFLSVCFGSKRNNGWALILGNDGQKELTDRINTPWSFQLFYTGAKPPSPKHTFTRPDRITGSYYFLNMLLRYAFIYGRKGKKDCHDIGHFIEDFAPGVMVCHGDMSDFDWTLALALMKMGVPALVPESFPFSLGRKIICKNELDIVDGIVQFTNIRRLLDIPGITQLPEYCKPEHKAEKFTKEAVFGDTGNSYYLMEPGKDVENKVTVNGTPTAGLGVLITAAHPRLAGMDCIYIESQIIGTLSQVKGVRALKKDNKLLLQAGNGRPLDPEKIGEVIQKAIKHEFPKIDKIHVSMEFDEAILATQSPAVKKRTTERYEVAAKVNEDTIPEFYYCVGCSPFAPDHACVLTPDRAPQCGRPFMMIRTGALFGYDDMSSIHHRILHKDINSFGVLEKGECLDTAKGEWTGINEYAVRLTDGRTPKVYLHTLFDHPTTGCGCFGIIMFHIPEVDGFGIMHRAYDGTTPDGRAWIDLKYELAGKQTSGVAGCGAGYFASPRFLQGDGGWKRVVWTTKKIRGMIDRYLPEGHDPATEENAATIDDLKNIIKHN